MIDLHKVLVNKVVVYLDMFLYGLFSPETTALIKNYFNVDMGAVGKFHHASLYSLF